MAGSSPELLVGAVLPAAGSGVRFGEPKQFKTLGDRPLLWHALQPFLDSPLIAEVVIPVPPQERSRVEDQLTTLPAAKIIRVVAGGQRRQDSVQAALEVLSPSCELVCIHDAVRPFLTVPMIAATVEGCRRNDAAIVALPARDTIKLVDPARRRVEKTLPRATVWQAQTPQTFRKKPLLEALARDAQERIDGTDEAALVERLGYQVAVVPGSPLNLKITTPEDWLLAEAILRSRRD